MYSGLQAVQLIQTLIFLSLVWTFCWIKCILELLIYFPLIVNNQSGQTAYNLQKKMTFEGINKPWHRHIFDLLNNTNLYRHPPNPPCLWSIVCLLLFIMPIKEHLFNPADPKSTETFLSFLGKILSYEMKPIKEKNPFCIQLCRTLSYCDEQKPRIWCQDKITIKKLPALPDYQTYPWI